MYILVCKITTVCDVSLTIMSYPTRKNMAVNDKISGRFYNQSSFTVALKKGKLV